MVSADLPELTDLWIAVWQKAVPRIDFETRRTWFVDRMTAHRAAGARTIVALHGGDLVGFVVVDSASGYLDQIAAADAWQGRGLASALLDAAKAAAPAGIDLHVNRDNARAICFYQKHGFAISGEEINPNSGAPIYQMSWRP